MTENGDQTVYENEETIPNDSPGFENVETLFQSPSNRRSGLAWHGITSIAGRLLSVATTAFSGLVLARSLGPEDFAQFSVILAIVSIFSIVAAFGLWNVAPVIMAQAHSQDHRLRDRRVHVVVRTLMVTASIGSLGAFGILAYGSQIFFDQTVPLIFSFVIALCIFSRALLLVFAEIARAKDQVVVANLFAGIGGGGVQNGVLLGGLALLCCFYILNWEIALLALLFSCFVSFLIYMLLNWIEHEPVSFTTSVVFAESVHDPSIEGLTRKVAVSGFFFTLLGLLIATTDQADTIIAAMLSGPLETSNYVAARRGSSMILTLTACAQMASGVVITRMYQRGQIERLNEVMRTLSAMVSILGLLVCSLIFIFPETFLSVLFGAEYRGGWQLLMILTVSQLVICFTGNGGLVLMMTGHERVVLLVQVFAVLLLTTLGGYLAWSYGLLGFTVAVSIGQALQSIVNCILSYTKTGINTFPDYRRLLTLKTVFSHASSGK